VTTPRAEAAARLEARIGHVFADRDLLDRALTHASVGEISIRPRHNERLEFLGDRVLGLLAAEALMLAYPDEREGTLTLRHHALVNGETCARVAREIELGAALRLGGGASGHGGRENDTILGDAIEALIAAVFLDGGLEPARRMFAAAWAEELTKTGAAVEREPKTALQEWAQGKGLPLPAYTVVQRTGTDHSPSFKVEVQVKGFAPVSAQASSKRAAEKAAARAFLTREGGQ